MSGYVLSFCCSVVVVLALSVFCSSRAERFAKHKLVNGELKPLEELPHFCNPLVIFGANWMLMMVSLSFQVTYVTYPRIEMPLLLFGISLGSFLFGYIVSRMLLQRWPTSNAGPSYSLDLTQLWQLNLLLCGAALIIMIYNWVLTGPPPAVGDQTSYLTYGRFKQVLFPLLVTVTVNASLDSSRWRKALYILYGEAGMT